MNRIRLGNHYLSYGEEACLAGTRPSALFYFTGCDLACVYCSAAEWSQRRQGVELTPGQLAGLFLKAEQKGAANINLCNIVEHLRPVVRALEIAKDEGLSIPVVYNSAGYDTPALMRCILPHLGVYLVDFKYADDALARRLSGAVGYVERFFAAAHTAAAALGENRMRGEHLARGLLLRHLLLPGLIENAYGVVDALAKDAVLRAYPLHLLVDFQPEYKSPQFLDLGRMQEIADDARRVSAYAAARGLRLI